METIRTYLSNIFSSLPKTDELYNLKNDMQNNMEDKYNELISSGKSESEAIFIVISEFGNIQELINELDIDVVGNNTCSDFIDDKEDMITHRNIDEFEAQDIINEKKRLNFCIAFGVLICILGLSVASLLSNILYGNFTFVSLNPRQIIISLIPFAIFVCASIALFAYAGIRLSEYDFLQENFKLSENAKIFISEKQKSFKLNFAILIAVGVFFCIVSLILPIINLTSSNSLSKTSLSIGFAILSVGVFVLIIAGTNFCTIEDLAKYKEKSVADVQADKVIGAVAAIVWPIAICIYFVISFLFNAWAYSWLIFVVVSFLFAAFSGGYAIITKEITSHMYHRNK